MYYRSLDHHYSRYLPGFSVYTHLTSPFLISYISTEISYLYPELRSVAPKGKCECLLVYTKKANENT